MRLYIGRHCYAGDPDPDPKKERERPLLPEGKVTAAAIANAMVDAGEVPNCIFCSPFRRAIDTADIYGRIFGIQVNVIGDLAPVRPLEDAIATLIGSDKLSRVMLIGHVDNTTPAMKSFDGEDKWPDLVMGEARRVKINRDDCSWSLKWGIKPSDIGRKDRKS
jgi:phosphohistidine phosphatase SixA